MGHVQAAMNASVSLRGMDTSYEHPDSFRSLETFVNTPGGPPNFNGPAIPIAPATTVRQVTPPTGPSFNTRGGGAAPPGAPKKVSFFRSSNHVPFTDTIFRRAKRPRPRNPSNRPSSCPILTTSKVGSLRSLLRTTPTLTCL